jgi:hypothetical protein
MRKVRLVLSLVVIASIVAPLQIADAAPKPPKIGSACTKVGVFFDTPNMRYVCNKEGAKLVWRTWYPPKPKSSSSPAPVASASPTPAPTQSAAPAPAPTKSAAPAPVKPPFKAKIPIPLPVPLTGPFTFDTAAANFAKIPEQAYSNVQAAIAAGVDPTVNVAISVGPTTNTTQDVILNGIKRELKLFSGFTTPVKLQAIAYNAADTGWAADEWTRVSATYPFTNNPKNYLSRITDGCEMQGTKAVNCGGGYTFMVPGSDTKFIFYGVENGNFWTANPPDYQTATQVNHEFTHAIQFAQLEGVAMHSGDNVITDTAHRLFPCWFAEGQANALGISIYIPTLATYLQVRDRTVTTPLNPGQQNPLADYSAASFTKFLTTQDEFTGPDNPGCYRPGTGIYQLGYSVGMAATEALIAIGGPQATVALIAKGAEGLNWADAFQAVYGIPWADGAAALGKILAAEYAVKPLNR